jgi:hypothetical protein
MDTKFYIIFCMTDSRLIGQHALAGVQLAFFACLHALYSVSQEECAILRESVPYVKLYRYNPKHLYLKFNGYLIMASEMCGLRVFPGIVTGQLTCFIACPRGCTRSVALRLRYGRLLCCGVSCYQHSWLIACNVKCLDS